MNSPNKPVKPINVGFHAGNTILHLAGAYSRPLQVVFELIQNGIDSDATHILVKVDERGDRLIYADNGCGASYEEIVDRFGAISERKKTDRIGRKGIGNLAALSIGQSYDLITRPRREVSPERFFQITVSKDGLEKMKDCVAIPCERKGKVYRPGSEYRGANLGTTISTLHVTHRISKAAMRQLRDAGVIARAIEDRFGTHITGRNLKVYVEAGSQRIQVVPRPFPGIPNEYFLGSDHGQVKFEIYVLTKPEKAPRLEVVHGKTPDSYFAISFAEFAEVSDAVKRVMGSGYLQGRIYVPFCTLTPDRTSLEYDDELETFWGILDEWARGHGQRLLDQIEESQLELRYEKVILGALTRLNRYIKDDPSIHEVLNGFVTSGHAGVGDEKPVGQVRSRELERRTRSGSATSRTRDQASREAHVAHSGVRESGSKRVRHKDQPGIVVEYRDPLFEEPRDWASKREGNVIVFNSLHPYWRQVESTPHHEEYCFMLLMKEIAIAQDPSAGELFNGLYEGQIMKIWLKTKL